MIRDIYIYIYIYIYMCVCVSLSLSLCVSLVCLYIHALLVRVCTLPCMNRLVFLLLLLKTLSCFVLFLAQGEFDTVDFIKDTVDAKTTVPEIHCGDEHMSIRVQLAKDCVNYPKVVGCDPENALYFKQLQGVRLAMRPMFNQRNIDLVAKVCMRMCMWMYVWMWMWMYVYVDVVVRVLVHGCGCGCGCGCICGCVSGCGCGCGCGCV